MPTSTNFGYLLYFTPVTTMPPECTLPKPDNTGPAHPACDHTPDPCVTSEIVSPDSTFAIYEEALAETRTVVRDEAKEIIKQRILEVERLRTTLARAEEALAKLLKKTPEEIASISTFSSMSAERTLRRLQEASAQNNLRKSLGMS